MTPAIVISLALLVCVEASDASDSPQRSGAGLPSELDGLSVAAHERRARAVETLTLVRGVSYTELGPVDWADLKVTDKLVVMTDCGAGEFVEVSSRNPDGAAVLSSSMHFSLGQSALTAAPMDYYRVCWCRTRGPVRCNKPAQFLVEVARLKVVGARRAQEKTCVVGQKCEHVANVEGLSIDAGDRIAIQLSCGAGSVVSGFPGSGFAEVVMADRTKLYTFTTKGCANTREGWVDSHGYTCDDYVDNMWCQEGDVGSGWVESWGSFDDYSHDGDNALSACCGCREPEETQQIERRLSCEDSRGSALNANNDPCGFYADEAACTTDHDDEDFSVFDMCCVCGGGCGDTNNGATDRDGDGCDFYRQSPTACGTADDADFTALQMCCACAGGVAGDCSDGAGAAVDSEERGCDHYANFSEDCGAYDDADFTASDMCCACSSTTQGDCSNSAGSATDSYLNGCDYYADWTDECGLYDDEDFSALAMCCACSSGGCIDADRGVVDAYGYSCADYDAHPDWCGLLDTPTFVASELCCSCETAEQGDSDECVTNTAVVDTRGSGCGVYTDPGDCGLYDWKGFNAAYDCCSCEGVNNFFKCDEYTSENDCPYSSCEWNGTACEYIYWKVTGPCVRDNNCVRSSGYPEEDYGMNEQCRITPILVYGPLSVTSWLTEPMFDKMEVNGEIYDGVSGPNGVMPVGVIRWTSDGSVSKDGWEICLPLPENVGDVPPGSPQYNGTYSGLVTSTTTTTTRLHEVETVLSANAGIYRLCYCRPLPELGQTCGSPNQYRADVGLFTVVGPWESVTLECSVGAASCTLPKLRGVGLKDGDEIKFFSISGRQTSPCRGLAAEVGEFNVPNHTTPGTVRGSRFEFGSVPDDAVPGQYAMCWRPKPIEGDEELAFSAFAGWVYFACPPGSYVLNDRQGGSSCMPCTRGYYCEGGSSAKVSRKRKCPQHQTTAGLGVRSISACICVPGYKISTSKPGECEPCKEGTYRNESMPLDACAACPTGFGPEGAARLAQCTCDEGYIDFDEAPNAFNCTLLDENSADAFDSMLKKQGTASAAGLEGSLGVSLGSDDDGLLDSLKSSSLTALSKNLGLPLSQLSVDVVSVGNASNATEDPTRRLTNENGAFAIMWTSQVKDEAEAADVGASFNLVEVETGLLDVMPDEFKAMVSDFAVLEEPTATSVNLNCSERGDGYAFPFGLQPVSVTECECSAGFQPDLEAEGATVCQICTLGSFKDFIGSRGCASCGPMSCSPGETCPEPMPLLSTTVQGSKIRSTCTCPPGYYFPDATKPTECSNCGKGYYCRGGDHRGLCRPGATSTWANAFQEWEDCQCEVADGQTGRSPAPACSCETNYYFKRAAGEGSTATCALCGTGMRCLGGFNPEDLQHVTPIALKGYFMTGPDVVTKCTVVKAGASVCTGGFPFGSTEVQCDPGHTGLLCGACQAGFTRDSGGSRSCKACDDLGSTAGMIVGTFFDLLCKSFWAMLLGKRAMYAAGAVKTVDSVVMRIGMQWMAVNAVLRQFPLNEVSLYGWSTENIDTSGNQDQADPLEDLQSMFKFPKWWNDAWDALFAFSGTLPDLNVGTNQEVLECLSERWYGEGTDEKVSTAKLVMPAIWWLFYPFALMILLFCVLVCFAKIGYPIVEKAKKKTKGVLKEKLVKMGARPASVDKCFAGIVDKKLTMLTGNPSAIMEPEVLRAVFGTQVVAEIMTEVVYKHAEAKMKAAGRDRDTLEKCIGAFLDDEAAGALRDNMKVEMRTLGKAGVAKKFASAITKPGDFAVWIADLIANVPQAEFANSVALYNPTNNAMLAGIGNYPVFNMFRSTSVKHVILDAWPVLLIALYSIWDMLTKRFLLLLQARSVVTTDSATGQIVQMYVWLGDTRTQVFLGDHLGIAIIGMVGLALWSVFFIWCVYLALRRRRKHLMEPRNLRGFGFFYSGLEPKFYWWELFVKRMDVLVVYIITFTQFVPDVKAKLILYCVVAGVAWAIHNLSQPFDNRLAGMIDKLESRGLQTRFLTFALIQVLLISDAPEWFNVVCAVILLLANFSFVLTVAITWIMEVVGDEETKGFRAAMRHTNQDQAQETGHGPGGWLMAPFRMVFGRCAKYLIEIPKMIARPISRQRRMMERRVPHFEFMGPQQGVRIHQYDESEQTGCLRKALAHVVRKFYGLHNEVQLAFAAESTKAMLEHLLISGELNTLPEGMMDFIFVLPIALRRAQLNTANETISVDALVKEVSLIAEESLQLCVNGIPDESFGDSLSNGLTSDSSRKGALLESKLTQSAIQSYITDGANKFKSDEDLKFACTPEQLNQGLMFLQRLTHDAIHDLVQRSLRSMSMARAVMLEQEDKQAAFESADLLSKSKTNLSSTASSIIVDMKEGAPGSSLAPSPPVIVESPMDGVDNKAAPGTPGSHLDI